MTEGKRAYRSPLREEQARRTRTAVLDAAAACFLERGYAATTMREVAVRADVSVQTVFGQGSKASLLLACVDRAVVGDDDAVPLVARKPFVRFMSAPDLDGKLSALGQLARRYVPQTLPMIWVFTDAAAGDGEVARAWAEYEQRRRADVRALIGALEPWLRPGLDVQRAADIYWALFSEAPARSLTRGLGWTVDQYAELLVDATRRLLLD